MQVNRDKLSDFLGVSPRRIDELVREGMPGERPKVTGDSWKFDTAAAVEWLRQKERQNVLGEVVRIDETEAKRRKVAAEAALMELELAKAQGKVLPISDFSKSWERMIGSCRAKLLGLGSKLGPALAIMSDASQCSVAIDRELNEALQELSDFEPEVLFESASDTEHAGGDPQTPEAVGTAAGSNGQRVGGRGKATQQRVQRGARKVSNLPN